MRSGYYFSLDTEAHKEGMVIFRYHYGTQDVAENSRIYMTFSNECVRFYLHRYDVTKHFSGCILSLALSRDADIRNSLSLMLDSIPGQKVEVMPMISGAAHEYAGVLEGLAKDSDSKYPFIQILLLDFMFEMEHGTVFRQASEYDAVYSALHDHYLFNAIVAKAEYFYSRNLFNAASADQPASDDAIEFYAYIKAERRWCEIIMDHRSERIFHESGWFKEATEELNDLYSNRNGHKDCIDRNDDANKEFNEFLGETAKMAINWYMSKYRPDGVMRIRFGHGYKRPFYGLSTAVFLLAFSGVIYSLLYDWGISDSCLLRTLFCVVGCACGVAAVLSYIIPAWKSRHRGKLLRSDTIPNIFMPRLFAGIAAGWMTVGLSDLVAGGAHAHSYYQYAWTSVLIILPVLLFFIHFSVKKILPYTKSCARWFISLILLSVSTVYSMLIGWGLLEIYSGNSYFFGCTVDAPAPKTLLVFSIISMFVGIFIQMLFHKKSISSIED